jgi:ketosteroid isomerase-like protein
VEATAPRMRALTSSGLLLLASLALACPAAAQGNSLAQGTIRRALTQWMTDFNAGNADKICGLFAPDLIAQVRGQPERRYGALCDLLQHSLSDQTKTYTYALDIKEILVADDLAVVRLVWTLKVRQKGTDGETTFDELGLDVFRRQPDGSWKIARFMSYDTSP